jgi:hypothetical protein
MPEIRKPADRVSIAACSRLLRAIENGVDLDVGDDVVHGLVRACRLFIFDPHERLASVVLGHCLQVPELIQFLEPPIDQWVTS